MEKIAGLVSIENVPKSARFNFGPVDNNIIVKNTFLSIAKKQAGNL